jgi:hypothetical protein
MLALWRHQEGDAIASPKASPTTLTFRTMNQKRSMKIKLQNDVRVPALLGTQKKQSGSLPNKKPRVIWTGVRAFTAIYSLSRQRWPASECRFSFGRCTALKTDRVFLADRLFCTVSLLRSCIALASASASRARGRYDAGKGRAIVQALGKQGLPNLFLLQRMPLI